MVPSVRRGLVTSPDRGQAGAMAKRSLRRPVGRRLLTALWIWLGLQAVVAVAGRLAARRLDEGDESSTSIRRVVTMGGLELRPTSPTLARVRVDLVMAGGELDFTEAPPLPGGVDVTVRAVMAGMSIRVPRGWRVWSEFSGVGGMGAGPGVQETPQWVEADLRLHARAVFGGIGVESAGS
jgi:hypothetical protein